MCQLWTNYTIPTFDIPEERIFWKYCEKKEQMLVTNILFFSHNALNLIKAKIINSATFILSSANAFNFDLAKILLFGKVDWLCNI